MNRFLTIVLLCVAAILLVWAGLFANFLHVLDSTGQSKMVWGAAGMGLLLAVAAWRLSLRAKFRIFAAMSGFLLVELCLQAAGWLGVLPAVNTKLKVPFARVYWSAEGRGNSIRNRYGWYFPGFNLTAPHRIAFVGDSQVEAVEVPRSRNQAALLQGLLRQKSPDWAVLGLGTHGTCPAHSIEVLDYAHRHFQPQEAIVVVSVGSDVTEASPELNGMTPEQYIYYELSTNGTVSLNPRSAARRAKFNTELELSHRSLLVTLPMILSSHCMTLQLVTSIRDSLSIRRRQAALAVRGQNLPAGEREQFQRLGFNPAPFALNPEPAATQAMAILLGQLRRCQEVCQSHGMTLRLVTIPSFPKVFYDTQHGTNWTMQIGNYDYLKPERELADFARAQSIPLLAMGEYFKDKKLTAEEIRSLYLSGGLGHLTEKGHGLCAQAIYDAFYQPPKP